MILLVMLSTYSITNSTADIIDDCEYGFFQIVVSNVIRLDQIKILI